SGIFYEAFCGDAAKYEAHLAMHEAALRAMKQSLTASFRHFFCCSKMLLWDCLHFIQAIPHFCKKKWRGALHSNPRCLNPGFCLEKLRIFE
ncbi:MAG: hypothetical protein IKB74_00685, partial [Lentisphaeria bacterium]|nr:hypothetical protein [Lentisphaeria bacterium]